MKFALWFSNAVMPIVIFYIIGMACLMKRPVYDDFIEGASNGARLVFKVMPTLVGMMMAVSTLRCSGFLDAAAASFSGFAGKEFAAVVPTALVKLFSSGAATGLAMDLFKKYGPDSRIGLAVSIMLSCTETVFYTMSLYFMSVKVKKVRWALSGALLCNLIGTMISFVLASFIIL